MKILINIAAIFSIGLFIASIWMRNIYMSMAILLVAVLVKKLMDHNGMMTPPLFKNMPVKRIKK